MLIMSRSLSNSEKNFVESMVNNMEKKQKPQAYSAKDVSISEVEQLTKSIQSKIQRGELIKGK